MRNRSRMWRDHLVEFYHYIELNIATICELKEGLSVGHFLNLSTDYAFNYLHLGDLLVKDDTVRPFYQLT